MLRLFALFALAVVLWLLLESGAAFVRGRLTGRRPVSRMPRPGPARTVGLELVRCAGCGVHVPQQRALRTAGESYCEACGAGRQGSQNAGQG